MRWQVVVRRARPTKLPIGREKKKRLGERMRPCLCDLLGWFGGRVNVVQPCLMTNVRPRLFQRWAGGGAAAAHASLSTREIRTDPKPRFMVARPTDSTRETFDGKRRSATVAKIVQSVHSCVHPRHHRLRLDICLLLCRSNRCVASFSVPLRLPVLQMARRFSIDAPCLSIILASQHERLSIPQAFPYVGSS